MSDFQQSKWAGLSVGMISNFLTAVMPLMVLFGYDLNPQDIEAVKAAEEAVRMAGEELKSSVEGVKTAVDGIKDGWDATTVAIGALGATLGGIWGRWRANKTLTLLPHREK